MRENGGVVRGRVWESAPCALAKCLQVSMSCVVHRLKTHPVHHLKPIWCLTSHPFPCLMTPLQCLHGMRLCCVGTSCSSAALLHYKLHTLHRSLHMHGEGAHYQCAAKMCNVYCISVRHCQFLMTAVEGAVWGCRAVAARPVGGANGGVAVCPGS